MSIHFHKLAVKDVRRETASAISISFEIPKELEPVFRFEAGQNITVRTFVNGLDVRRSYSICSAPHENESRIAVKATGGTFSTWVNRELLKGHYLDVLPPTGRFSVTPDSKNKKHYLAIAAGSGITPILSIINTVLNSEPGSSVTLLFGNRNRAPIMFREQLCEMKNRFMSRFAVHHVLSGEITDAEIYSGRLTVEKCKEPNRQLIDFASMDEIYLCGPESMIFGIRDWLLSEQISSNKIHYELFTTPVQNTSSAEVTAPVKVAAAGAIEGSATDRLTVAGAASTGGLGTDPFAGSPKESIAQSPMPPNNATESTSEVTVKLDGTQYQFKLSFEGEPILEAALRQGADLPFSCKGGVCSTCRAKLMEGEVSMDLNYALEPEEVAQGFILCCQSHPRTEKVVIDFDHK